MRYEYTVEIIPNEDMIDYVDALNVLGYEGWELIVEMMAEGVDESVCTFKRQLVEINPSDSICNN